eukprot:jgi/Phyca11/12920/fgenesh1_pg.PHYCAscaffold_2_\
MTVTGEEQVSESGVERLGGTVAGLENTGTGPTRQGELSMSSTDEEEGVTDPSTGVRTAAGRLSTRQVLRGDLEAAGDDGGTEGSEHPPAQDDVKEEVKPEPRAQEEWVISGGEESATVDHEEMGQYAEEEAVQGEYVTDPEEGREYDIDEYGRYYLSGYYGDVDEEEVKPPTQSSSGFIPLFTGAEKRRSDRPSTGWGWDPSRGAMQVQMVPVLSPTGVKSTQRVQLTGKPRTPAPPRPLGPPQMRTSVGTVGATTGRFAARSPATAPNPSSAAPPALGTVASESTAMTTSPGNGQGYSGNGQGFSGNGRTRGIKMAADTRTQEGEPVCAGGSAWKQPEEDGETVSADYADEDQGTVDTTTSEPERAIPNRAEATDVECLFTYAELDAMEACELGQEATVLAGTDVRPEPEYDKELEDRLYPRKDGEIMDRVQVNAEAVKEPSTVELSHHLGIPVEVLERTRHASPDGSDDPERWRDWYSDTLQKSEEAKRANRDFRTPVVNVVDGTVMKDRTMSPPHKTTTMTCYGSDAEVAVSGGGSESDENMMRIL